MKKTLVLSALSALAIVTAGIAGAASTSPPAAPGGPPGSPGMMRGHGGWDDAIGPMFKQVDANGDGKITRAEIEAAGDKRFDAADTNHDGKLSQGEIDAARAAARAEREAKMFKRWDKNGDGVLSKDESVGRALARFDAVDTNRDGTISDEERSAARSAMRAKWKEHREDR